MRNYHREKGDPASFPIRRTIIENGRERAFILKLGETVRCRRCGTEIEVKRKNTERFEDGMEYIRCERCKLKTAAIYYVHPDVKPAEKPEPKEKKKQKWENMDWIFQKPPEPDPPEVKVPKPRKARPGKLDKNKAYALWQEGLNDKEIGMRCGVTSNTIWNWRQKNNLERNSPPGGGTESRDQRDREEMMRLYKEKWTDREIAEKLKCSRKTICAWRNRNKLPPNGQIGRPKTATRSPSSTDNGANGQTEASAV